MSLKHEALLRFMIRPMSMRLDACLLSTRHCARAVGVGWALPPHRELTKAQTAMSSDEERSPSQRNLGKAVRKG